MLLYAQREINLRLQKELRLVIKMETLFWAIYVSLRAITRVDEQK